MTTIKTGTEKKLLLLEVKIYDVYVILMDIQPHMDIF